MAWHGMTWREMEMTYEAPHCIASPYLLLLLLLANLANRVLMAIGDQPAGSGGNRYRPCGRVTPSRCILHT